MNYLFCLRCSKRITKKSESLYICNSCDFHLYENPRPTNGLIAENKKGFWDVAGGFVDIGETLEESFLREIQEELGVEVQNLQYLTSTADRYLYKETNYHTICFLFTGNVDQKKIVAHDDISEIKFFPKNKIPYDRIAFAGIKTGLKLYLYSFAQNKK